MLYNSKYITFGERNGQKMKKSVIAITLLVLTAVFFMEACTAGQPLPAGQTTERQSHEGTTKTASLNWSYSADKYSQGLAEQAALYAMLAYDESICDSDGNYYSKTERDDPPVPASLQAQLSADGYLAVQSENYGNDEEHDISYTLAYQKLDNDRVLLVVVLRGTDGVEWLGNMDVGRETRHESFEKANQALQADVKAYVDKHTLKNVIYFVTGHSRGAAVANLFAADMTALESNAGSVFCYAFATPNNTTAPTKDKNIFNFCFEDDFVPQVPLARWDYGKYGKTFTASAETLYETNSDFKELVDTNITLSFNREPSFDQKATEKVLDDFYSLAPTVEVYYTKEYQMSPDHGLVTQEKDLTMHDFMRNYIGNAAAKGLEDLGASLGSALKRLPAGNEVKAVADYFIEGWLPPHSRDSINDTHQAFTYYAAIKTGGFPTPE